MSEKKWSAATDPEELEKLTKKPRKTERKLRLYCVACCRRISHLIVHPGSQESVELGEAIADGLVDAEIQERVFNGADEALGFMCDIAALASGDPESMEEIEFPIETVRKHYEEYRRLGHSVDALTNAAEAALHPSDMREGQFTVSSLTAGWAVDADSTRNTEATEKLAQCDLWRDIFGDHFKVVSLDPAWITTDTKNLAEEIYQSKDFSEMPRLGQLLRDAGCASEAVLNHCEKELHVRGCWLIDQLTDRQ